MAAVGIACGDTSFESTATDAGVDSSASDASAGDGAIQDGGDDSGNVPGNLVQDFGFEDGPTGGGCGAAWVNGNANTTLSISTTARTGSFSCMMCTVNNQYGSLQPNAAAAPIKNPVGGLYTATAWMTQVSPDGGPPPPDAKIQLFDSLADGGLQAPTGSTAGLNSSTWTPVTLSAELGAGQSLGMSIITIPSGSASSACALVDDVSIVGP